MRGSGGLPQTIVLGSMKRDGVEGIDPDEEHDIPFLPFLHPNTLPATTEQGQMQTMIHPLVRSSILTFCHAARPLLNREHEGKGGGAAVARVKKERKKMECFIYRSKSI